MTELSWVLNTKVNPLFKIKHIVDTKDGSIWIFYYRLPVPSRYDALKDEFKTSYLLDHHIWNSYKDNLITYNEENKQLLMVTDHGEIALSIINLNTQKSKKMDNCGNYHAHYLLSCNDLIYFFNSSKSYCIFKQNNTKLENIDEIEEEDFSRSDGTIFGR